MSTVNEKCLELAVFLQAVASYEAQIEKGRLALNLLKFYSPQVAFKILTEFCPGGVISQNDLADFLKDWQVVTTASQVRGIFLDFCAVRSIMDYQSYLLMTLPSAFLDKKRSEITLESLSEELRFKLESSLVLFFMKELKFQSEIEQRRVKLIQNFPHSILALYQMVDPSRRGYVKYEDVAQFLNSYNLEFEMHAWTSLVFRAKKRRCFNAQNEKITFTEFHDLLYPIQFLEQAIEGNVGECLSYFDLKEQGNTPEFPLSQLASTDKESRQHHTPQKSGNQYKSATLSDLETAAHSNKKSGKKEVSFFNPFYEIHSEDQGKVLFALSNPGTEWMTESDRGYEPGIQFHRSSKKTPSAESRLLSKEESPLKEEDAQLEKRGCLDFNADYSRHFQLKQLPSKFSRYLITLKEASNTMYD